MKLRFNTQDGSSWGRACVVWLSLFFAATWGAAVSGKSLYVIANINGSPTPIQTYDIQGVPNYLVFQAQTPVPRFGGGAVALAIDPDNANVASPKLFVTYEVSNTIQLLNAVSFANLGTTTAPGATNLAGIVFDEGRNKIYTVDRNSNNLYVYSFDTTTDVLTLDRGTTVPLVGTVQAHGLAIDESRGLLYVSDLTTDVKVYNLTDVNDLSLASIPLANTVSTGTQPAQGIAVDTKRNHLFTGNSYGPFGSTGLLVKNDLDTGNVVGTFNVRTYFSLPSDNIVGLAVDEDTGNVYATTGNQGVGGSDRLLTLDENLIMLKDDILMPGDPTGIAIPRAETSFNPLNLTKVDDVDPVTSGNDLTYTLCFDNLTNPNPVVNVVLVDELPADTTFVSATAPGVYDALAGTVIWDFGTVAGNAPAQCVDLVVQVDAGDGSTLLNRATIDSDDTPPTTQAETTDVVGGPAVCDIEPDGDIDRLDLRAISRARGQLATGPGDPRDADGDGVITTLDVKACIPQCTLARCAILP